MYEFTRDCMIGNEQIDKEHAYLFQLINSGFDAFNKTDEERKVVFDKLLVELKDYTIYHFSREEKYMEELNDPELPMQKVQHQAFMKKLDELCSQRTGTKEDDNAILMFGAKWLYQHILTSDIMIGKIQAEKDKSLVKIDYTERFATHVELIDDEHKKLFEIINKVIETISAEHLYDKYDSIIEIIGELKDYTQFHFADEEKLMLEIQYPDYEKQKKAHDAFIEKLITLDLQELESIDEEQEKYLYSLVRFLQEWLINHILKMDVLIGKFYKNNR